MILGDIDLNAWAENGGIIPYKKKQINPASVNLSLGCFYRKPVPVFYENDILGRIKKWIYNKFGIIIKPDRYAWSEKLSIPENGLVMKRNDFYLFHCNETVKIPDNLVGKLFLRSSAGRLGIEHLHAGYVDPGFEGQLTFELQMVFPGKTVLKKGQYILQLTLEECSAVFQNYQQTGRYRGKNADGPVKSLGF